MMNHGSKFQIGDEVVYISDKGHFLRRGSIGIVYAINNYAYKKYGFYFYYVDFSGHKAQLKGSHLDHSDFYGDYLEKIEDRVR